MDHIEQQSGWDVYQFAFKKLNGGTRFIVVGLDYEQKHDRNLLDMIQNCGSRLVMLAYFKDCENVQSFNGMIEIVNIEEFQTLWLASN